jgi:nicotinate-nucleotide adenylyltransferase
MRLGIYGGTFDPIHLGHLLLAESCLEACRLDEVRFVPAWRNPLKPAAGSGGGEATPGKLRAEMIAFAIAGHERFKVDSREFKREASSYTVDTLRDFAKELPQAELYFLMGADAWRDFAAWREPLEILRLASVVVVNRPGDAVDFDAPLRAIAVSQGTPENECAEFVSEWRPRVQSATMPAIGLAGRDIRARVREGRSVRFQVPRAVECLIEQHRLYR